MKKAVEKPICANVECSNKVPRHDRIHCSKTCYTKTQSTVLEHVCFRSECTILTKNTQYCSISCANIANPRRKALDPSELKRPQYSVMCKMCNKKYSASSKEPDRAICLKCLHSREYLESTLTLNSRAPKANRLIYYGIKTHKCEMCNNVEWNGQKIPIELDHIDGNNRNNKLENLRILCPNCHAQTPTYCRKKI